MMERDSKSLVKACPPKKNYLSALM